MSWSEAPRPSRRSRSRVARGCGFHLRGDADIPVRIDLRERTRRRRRCRPSSRARCVDATPRSLEAPTNAEVVLDVPVVVDDKDVLSLSSGGAVREYQLVKRVAFRLHDKEGLDWMPAGEIVVRRSYTFNETQVLARDLQEQRLCARCRPTPSSRSCGGCRRRRSPPRQASTS